MQVEIAITASASQLPYCGACSLSLWWNHRGLANARPFGPTCFSTFSEMPLASCRVLLSNALRSRITHAERFYNYVSLGWENTLLYSTTNPKQEINLIKHLLRKLGFLWPGRIYPAYISNSNPYVLFVWSRDYVRVDQYVSYHMYMGYGVHQGWVAQRWIISANPGLKVNTLF